MPNKLIEPGPFNPYIRSTGGATNIAADAMYASPGPLELEIATIKNGVTIRLDAKIARQIRRALLFVRTMVHMWFPFTCEATIPVREEYLLRRIGVTEELSIVFYVSGNCDLTVSCYVLLKDDKCSFWDSLT